MYYIFDISLNGATWVMMRIYISDPNLLEINGVIVVVVSMIYLAVSV